MAKARFAEEFKREAVKQVVERGYSIPDVSQRLGASVQSLYKWIKAYSPDGTDRVEAELNVFKQQNFELKARLYRAGEERDLLKIWWCIFALWVSQQKPR